MAPKRKSNALEPEAGVVATLQDARNTEAAGEAGPSTKKARADVSDAPASKGKKSKEPTKPRAGTTSPLRGRKRTRYRSSARTFMIPSYNMRANGTFSSDDCNEIRRKIRLLQKEPGFKLREIGKINNNSFQRFMKASGPTGGATNGTYYAAYVYFEKVRIEAGKKKTAKRERNEIEHPNGLPLVDRRNVWVFTGP
ncbi:hypothetical protein AcW2_001006 [Taiwanofungus camphoratus]|nr:hypothetical protein AcW2_001006 [Antrodia cinnamomea]